MTTIRQLAIKKIFRE
jgi:hypothetical protein